MLVDGKVAEDALDGLNGVEGVKSAEDEVTGFGGVEGCLHGFAVAHFTYEDDVGRLSDAVA